MAFSAEHVVVSEDYMVSKVCSFVNQLASRVIADGPRVFSQC